MIPIESASRGFLPFRFGGKTFARPLAEVGRFEPVDVEDRKPLFPIWDLALRPVPRRPSARRVHESGVVRVRYLVLVDGEGIQINVVGGSVIHLVPRQKVC